jgi:molybdopterin-guanine dinucleotide biosynthesis protein A
VSRAGYLLVEGRGARMGRDKASLPFRGGLLVQSVEQAVRLAAGSAVSVGNPGAYARLAFPAIADLYPGDGPLGGVLTALSHTPAHWHAVVACDLPEITAEFPTPLVQAAEHSGADALVPTGPSGRPEPLCAVYRRRAKGGLEAAFARGVRTVTAALPAVRATLFPAPELSLFQNVNTPEEWAANGA